MTKTLQTKQVAGGTDHYGEGTGTAAPYALFRFVDTDNDRDVRNATWRSTVEAAEKAWKIRHAA
jgi:predicted secreted protein